jgi:DDE superfamily endonuclease
VNAEQVRVCEILAAFSPRDRWNFDESSLFAFAPPDRGLVSKQMKGKKKDKFWLTLGFVCNADGSEKLPLFFIGKSRKPRCFGKQTPAQQGLYYQNNKIAWMTSELFEEYVCK